jgi:hypothetical protein
MNRISKYSFANCKVKIIILPEQVHVIDLFAFFESLIEQVSIEGSDDRFTFDQKSFRIDSDTSTAIRYFGKDNGLLISRDITILDQSRFSGCFDKRNKLGVVRFEGGSNLTMIDQSCFANCILQMICIPRSVDIIGKSCFMNCNIETMLFEVESSLT